MGERVFAVVIHDNGELTLDHDELSTWEVAGIVHWLNDYLSNELGKEFSEGEE